MADKPGAPGRLYLCGTLSNGKLAALRGSIGKVLPPSLTAAMASTGGEAADEIVWQGRAAAHVIRRVRFSLL